MHIPSEKISRAGFEILATVPKKQLRLYLYLLFVAPLLMKVIVYDDEDLFNQKPISKFNPMMVDPGWAPLLRTFMSGKKNAKRIRKKSRFSETQTN